MVSRLTQLMVAVIKDDATNERGLRNVFDGETEMLAGFEFNIRGKLGTSFFAPYTAAIDRKWRGDGGHSIVHPDQHDLGADWYEHYKIVSAGAEVDFEAETFIVESSESAVLPWDAVAIAQTNALPAASTKPLFLVLGIEFYQEVNAVTYPLKNGASHWRWSRSAACNWSLMEGNASVRICTASGTLLSIEPPLLAQDIVRTIILGAIGATVSFTVTLLLKWIVGVARKRRD